MEVFTLAVPKGRILKELKPLLDQAGIHPEDEFFQEDSRKLIFSTSKKNLQLIKVRSFDVATFVSYGAAQMGVCGSDVLEEFNYPNIYNMIDLNIGKCRLSIAAPEEIGGENIKNYSHIRIATKYVNLTEKYFRNLGIQAECIKLNGSIELAPKLGLCRRIVDLVSTGSTLKANKMQEGEKIMDISSRLVVNKNAYKTFKQDINYFINLIESSI
mgnify:CR=1 FL=1